MSSLYKNLIALQVALAVLMPAVMKGQGLITTNNSYLVANGAAVIVCNNSGFTNNGTFAAGNSTISLTGSSAIANSFIGGTSNSVFNNLTMNKTANGVQLNQSITINGTLSLSNGDSLFLNNHNIDLGTTGSISGETSSKRITGRTGGYIQIEKVLNAPSAVNPGNIGVDITSTANFGNTIIRRGHNQQGGASMYRYFDILPTNNAGLNATITVHYWDEELGIIPETDLVIFFSDDTSHWDLIGQDALNTVDNLLTKSGIDHFDRFTLANMGEPLSVNFLYLNANLKNGQTLVNWAVSSEMNNDHFEIERSVDGKHFIKCGMVRSDGNTTVTHRYQYMDPSPLPGLSYYRIKQVDIDYTFSYSDMVAVNNKTGLSNFINCYPNPVSSVLNLVFSSDNHSLQTVELFNASGNLIQSKAVNCVRGLNQISWDMSSVPQGIYQIRVAGSKLRTVQFVKM